MTVLNFSKTIHTLFSHPAATPDGNAILPAAPLKATSIIMLATLIDKKSKHIMLADDDVDDREMFVEAVKLIAPDVNVMLENDGVELMKTLHLSGTPAPDILFLDLNMPRKNGFECLEEIRKIGKMKSVPVVVYSTSSNPDYITNSYDKGANLYAVKPQNFKDIKQMILKIMTLQPDFYFPQPAKSAFVLR